jgi:hypothetical protein
MIDEYGNIILSHILGITGQLFRAKSLSSPSPSHKWNDSNGKRAIYHLTTWTRRTLEGHGGVGVNISIS